MNNAFEIWRELKSIYLKYIDTGLSIRQRELEEERTALLKEEDAICKYPIIELVPRYEEFKTLQETCKDLNLDPRFADFAKQGLFAYRNGIESKIYEHQFKALQAAAVNRKNIVATTGTGSGKTECFLFPLIYDILEEKLHKKITIPAIRGLILYPLNALAEDQMRRLRRSLSSDDAIAWLDQNANKKRITFGRYTGNTPLSGSQTPNRRQKLNDERKELERDWKSAQRQANDTNNIDYLYDIPNMSDNVKAEFWDRWTMQDTPPDILITNYSMLNIMLMREQEQDMFEQTRQWLANDANNVFHLVVDELHSYRGTSGTEVAYLLRLLLLRLGLTPDSKQVQFLCSSASMQETERTKKFITGFFGLERSQYDAKFELINDPAKNNQKPNNVLLNPFDFLDITVGNELYIKDLFEKNQVLEKLKYHIPRALQSDDIIAQLFDDKIEITESQKVKALENLLSGLSMLKNEKGDTIQPQRAHYFFRNVEGLWACTNKACSEVDTQYQYSSRKFGKLYRKPQSSCKCGAVVLEALLCRQCGELYLSGWEKIENGEKYLSIEKDISNETSILYTIYPEQDEAEDNWVKCDFDTFSGKLTMTSRGNKLIFQKPVDYKVPYPNHCCNCEYTETIRDENTLTPIHRHYTGVQKINQLMADAMMQALKKYNKHDAPKLVLFSDSRQAAAKLAAGIELDHYRDIVRAVLLNSLDAKNEEKEILKKYYKKETLLPKERNKFQIIRNSNEYTEIINQINDFREFGDFQNEIETYFNARNIVRIDRIENAIINSLFTAGINPGGPVPSVNNPAEGENWADNYDFNQDIFRLLNNGVKEEDLDRKIKSAVKKEILVTIFSHNKRSLEALCQGTIMPESQHPNSNIQEFIVAAIRLLGENWRIDGTYKNQATGFPKKLWKYARVVFDFRGWNFPQQDLDNILTFLVNNSIVKDHNNRLLTGKG
ncbi:MAG: hypothetical protein RLZZ292_3897, partial [Bacteroidota bacterium]